REAATIVARLARVCASGRPRRPSLAPSAMTTTSGCVRDSAASMREAPPAVVSPLMLALTTVHPGYPAWRRSPSSDTQPCDAAIPSPAASESPITSAVRPGLATAAHASSSTNKRMAHCILGRGGAHLDGYMPGSVTFEDLI